MPKWCSYCEQFMGEVPDCEDLAISHGICSECYPKALSLAQRYLEHALFLKGNQRRLFVAGQSNDLEAAGKIIEDAAKANCRPVDVLIGIIAPIFYEVGEDWKRGVLSVKDEHRFTAFCEQTFDLVAAKIDFGIPASSIHPHDTDFLLLNAPGNRHTLAIRILALWLASKGTRVRIADQFPNLDELVALIDVIQPNALVSMALAEQRSGLMAIAKRIEGLPKTDRPKVIVGGNAVTLGLASRIPAADLMADISSLPRTAS